jgi:hypothetical protein
MLGNDPNLWSSLTPDQLLERLAYEIYGPVSSLGSEVDQLASGTFEDEEELNELIEHMREHINALSRVVVALKRYQHEWQRSTDQPDQPD